MCLRRWIAWLLLSAVTASAMPRTPQDIAVEILAPLLDPAKIATLKGERPVNARLYRILGWLETARMAGGNISEVIDIAQAAAGYGGSRNALADRAALRWSWKNLNELGCFTRDGVAKLKKGGSPAITRGEHAGEKIHLDHILPRSVVPELDACFYNLEPIPAGVNTSKGARVGKNEITLARRWCRQGMLSAPGLAAVESAGRRARGISQQRSVVKE
jgi:hypothetical protein